MIIRITSRMSSQIKARMDYFTKHSLKANDKPLLMVVAHSAPHGPEDGARPYYEKFPDVKAPRDPNYNFTSLDKHWLIRNTPPLNNVTSQFTDTLHRKRLITLLSLDDAIENVILTLEKTGQLHNTYVFFSSGHGYHLGQFNLVKGKSQPYESDIRIPLYMRGPNIPKDEGSERRNCIKYRLRTNLFGHSRCQTEQNYGRDKFVGRGCQTY
uniref:Sulfatase N-terminal domain-containing protein n=1 Tax=Clytia hemisphaerica TaxID=252671 RepID=A0A7M5UYS6_9CNID